MFGYVTINKDELKIKDGEEIPGVLLRSLSGPEGPARHGGAVYADV